MTDIQSEIDKPAESSLESSAESSAESSLESSAESSLESSAESSAEHVTGPKKLIGIPEDQKTVESHTVATKTGIATRYWLELMSYPAGSTRSLWLFVNDDWRHLDNPDLGTQVSVQNAFCSCSERLEVLVWYSEDTIEGLIVKTK